MPATPVAAECVVVAGNPIQAFLLLWRTTQVLPLPPHLAGVASAPPPPRPPLAIPPSLHPSRLGPHLPPGAPGFQPIP